MLCIMGNAIDQEPHNGGNGIGYKGNIAYSLTTSDSHAIFSRQRTDVFQENDVVNTESVRQHKDAADLVMQPYQETAGTLVRLDHKGISNQYVNDDKCIVDTINLIRRLTPLECERLQGFPDGWTNSHPHRIQSATSHWGTAWRSLAWSLSCKVLQWC